MSDRLQPVTIEDAQLIFKNFSGNESQWNSAGDRNFAVVLPQEVADEMARDNWNIKMTNPREEGDEPLLYLPVAVRFDNKPPRITMITSTARTVLSESEVGILDYADIALVDLIVTPYVWTVRDATGVKAYLKTMFVTVNEDELEKKYAVRNEG